MSSFRDMVAEDNEHIFMNLDEFAETRTIIYDNVRFEDIPVVLTGIKEKDRRQLASDHAQGLFLVSAVLHCRKEDLGDNQPEKGSTLKISSESNPDFFRRFTVATSITEMGMLRIELEAHDE